MERLQIKRYGRRTLVFVTLIFAGWVLQGCALLKTSAEQSPYDFSAVDQRIQIWVDKGYYPGASLVIAKDNQIIHERYFGSYDPDTVVYIASSGKWLAAATIASVVDEGKLSWDDPVSKWLPEFAGVKGQATLRQLMSHTSGYQDYQKAPHERDAYQTLKKSVEEIVPLNVVYEPGTHFQYGGLAMQVAGRMAELASGMEWEELFQEKIATPLEMKNTHFTPVNQEPGHAPMLGGGARSTLRDYANFLSMISNNGAFKGRRILSAEAIVQMQADQVGAATFKKPEFIEIIRGNTHNGIYGLGEWREELDENGKAVLISSPSWAGAYPWVDKTCGIYGFFLTHVDTEAAGPDGFSGFYSSPILAMMVRQTIQMDSELVELPSDIKRGMVDVGDAMLYYETAGSGTPVILIHGHSLDRRMWDSQFAELAKHYRVIRYDLRGYGLSDVPRKGQDFMHVEDLRRFMEQLQIPKAHLVGLSLGGFIVVDALAMYPEKMLSGVAASGTIYPMPGPNQPVTEQERQKRQEEIEKLRETGIEQFKEQWRQGLLRSAVVHAEKIRPALTEMIEQWSAWQPLNVEPRLLLGTSVLQKLQQRDVSSVPFLVILGENDSKGAHDAAEEFLKVVPPAHKIVLENAGHMCNMEVPDEFYKELIEFYQSIEQKN